MSAALCGICTQAIEANSVDATAFLGRAQCFLKLVRVITFFLVSEVTIHLVLKKTLGLGLGSVPSSAEIHVVCVRAVTLKWNA